MRTLQRLATLALVLAPSVAQAQTGGAGPDQIPIDHLPFVIDRAAAYYLPASLTAEDDLPGIIVLHDDVSIDLNGNTLSGGGKGSFGIVTEKPMHHVSVSNGRITGWLKSGVAGSLIDRLRLERVSVHANPGDGVVAFNKTDIVDCDVSENGRNGILGVIGLRVRNCTIESNGLAGVRMHSIGRVESCTVMDNGTFGIDAGEKVRVVDCQVADNRDGGIKVSHHSVVWRNSLDEPTVGISLFGNAIDCRENAVESTGVGFEILGNHDMIVANSFRGGEFVSFVNPEDSGTHLIGPLVDHSNVVTGLHPHANFLLQ